MLDISRNITFHDQNVAVDSLERKKWYNEKIKTWKIVVPHCLDTQGLDNLLCLAQHESSFNYRAIGNKNQNPELLAAINLKILEFGSSQSVIGVNQNQNGNFTVYTSIVIKLETKILFRHYLNKYHTP